MIQALACPMMVTVFLLDAGLGSGPYIAQVHLSRKMEDEL